MNTARLYFYRDGKELTDHPANGFVFTGTDAKTGKFGDITAHKAFYGRPVGSKVEYHICAEDFGGAVSVKVWEGPKQWYWAAIAEHEDVEKAGGTVAYHQYNDRDGRGKPFAGHVPFSEFAAAVA